MAQQFISFFCYAKIAHLKPRWEGRVPSDGLFIGFICFKYTKTLFSLYSDLNFVLFLTITNSSAGRVNSSENDILTCCTNIVIVFLKPI